MGGGAQLSSQKKAKKTPFKWVIASSSIYIEQKYPKETIKTKNKSWDPTV